jgi:DNA-binding IclR family transcriptional regulator
MANSVAAARRSEVMSSSIRAFRVLELIASEPFEWGLMEVANALSMSKATTHRMLTTLMEAKFISYEPRLRRYFVSGNALAVASAFLRRSSAYRAAFPVMHDLVQKVKGMVHFGVLENDSLLFLRSYGQPSDYYLYADTGDLRPLHAYAMGKAILAHLPPMDVVRIMSYPCQAFTPRTITTLAAMKRELLTIRAKGFAINDEEASIGLRAVASAIFNQQGEVVASISISWSVPNMPPSELARSGALVRDAAIKISMQLGYRPAHLSAHKSTPRTNPTEAERIHIPAARKR